MPSTRSSAATKCISEVPGLEKHTLTPPPTSVRTRTLSTVHWTSFCVSQSGRTTPLTPCSAPSVSSAARMRAGSAGPGILIAPLGDALETDALVIRLVADQHDQFVALGFRVLQRALHHRHADAAIAERRLDGERPEHQRRRLADAHRRHAHGSDQQRADARRVGKIEPVRHLLADALRGAHVAARAEGALVQPLDRGRILGLFGQDREGKIGHEASPRISIWAAGGPLRRNRHAQA